MKEDSLKSIFQENSLYSLLDHNTSKMNYQQNMCFQIKNWAIVISLGLLTVSWSTTCVVSIFDSAIHLLALVILIYFNRQDKNWFCWFMVFRERVILLEKRVTGVLPAKASVDRKYYKYNNPKEIKANPKFSKEINYRNRLYIMLGIIVGTSYIIRLIITNYDCIKSILCLSS